MNTNRLNNKLSSPDHGHPLTIKSRSSKNQVRPFSAAPVRDRFETLMVGNRQISYADRGKGDPVVFIHCSTANAQLWQDYSNVDDYRYIATDQWNCGRSDSWSGHTEFCLYEEARPIVQLIDSLDTPVNLVGHSYGGSVALKVAMLRPDQIRKLILVEPSSFHLLDSGPEYCQSHFAEIRQLSRMTENAVRSGNYWSAMAGFTDYWNGSGSWESLPFKQQLKLSQRITKVVLDFHALINESTELNAYKTLTQPVLLVHGDRSPSPSLKIVELLAGCLADVRTQCVTGAGHMSPVTHMREVRELVLRHLKQ